MEDFFQQFIAAVYLRLTGTLKFRFILQPVMALVFAIIDGVRDAKAGKPLYLWGLITDPATRKEQMSSGWKSIGKLAILAVILDLVYQFIDKDSVNLLGSLVASIILAIVPYFLLRGPVNFIAGLIIRKNKKDNAGEDSA
jgi:hypothetical protein